MRKNTQPHVTNRESEDRVLLVLTLLIAAITGLVVVAFVALTERLGSELSGAGPLRRFLSPVLGSLAGGWLLFRYFPEARGSGIPQTRVALLLNQGVISLRTAAGKFLCSSLSLGSGIALGREGPSVHIGAGLASVIGRKLGLSEQGVRSLVPVGTAAAVAAAFNTPLAAVLFTLEEILADLHAKVIGSVVIGAATSWIVLRLLLGDEPIFHVPAYRLVHPIEFVIYIILGLAGGLVSTVFVKCLLWLRLQFLRTPAGWKPFAPAIGGLTVGGLAVFFPGVLGVGYNLVGDALNGQLGLQAMLLLLVLKLIATSTSYSSGNAGGVFGPSLFIGAMLGGVVGQSAHYLLPDLTANAGAYALVGMGAAFAGIIRTPMTSVIMIFEITRDYTIIVPLMLANLCSYFIAQRLQHVPLYEALLAQEGIRMPSDAHRPEPLLVETAMIRTDSDPTVAQSERSIRLHPDDPLDMAMQLMGAEAVDELPVVSRVGARHVGVIRRMDILAAYGSSSTPIHAELESGEPGSRSWLVVVCSLTLATVILVAGLVFWQRSSRNQLASEAYKSGEALLAQGRTEEAVQEFRSALANQPEDNQARNALGLALVQTEHFAEAAAYLNEAIRKDPENGPTRVGLARIEHAKGDMKRALVLMKQGIAARWPGNQESARVLAQMEYASWLYQEKRRTEGTLLLLSLIEQSGDDPATGRDAAEAIRKSDSMIRTEEAYTLLADRFPADSGILAKLAESRLANGKELQALETYRRARKQNPNSAEIHTALEQAELIVKLDPGQRGLSLRARGQRWSDLLSLVLQESAPCGDSKDTPQARRLSRTQSTRLELVDEKMAAVLALWNSMDSRCKQNPVLTHILSRPW